MAVRSTILLQASNGRGPRVIVADAVTDVDATKARFGDVVLDLSGNRYGLVQAAGVKSWLQMATPTAVGAVGAQTTYTGGTRVVAVGVGGAFNMQGNEATRYEVISAGSTATLLASTAINPIGTTFELTDKTGNANPNLTLNTPGFTISGPGFAGVATVNLTSQYFWRTITRQSNSNWLMAGV